MNREDIIRMAREAGIKLSPAQFSGVLDAEVDEFQLEEFAALVAAQVRETEFKPDWNNYQQGLADGAAEAREAIMDEWWMCVQSDLENGVKSLNERAAEKWRKEYPAMAGFDAAIRARGQA